MRTTPEVVLRWDREAIRADVPVPGVGVIELNKYGDEPWYAMRLRLEGGDEYLAFDDESGQGLSPAVPDSALVRALDAALDASDFTCECCGSLRKHAERVYREEKEYADRSLRAEGYTDCETYGCDGMAKPGRRKCLGCDERAF